MKTVSVKEIQKLDRLAIDKHGIPSLFLMENAGRAVADEVLSSLTTRGNAKVCIFCGLGNNAGDGFVAARYLIQAGVKVKVFLVGSHGDLKGDAAFNYELLKSYQRDIREIRDIDQVIRRECERAEILVDAIFGVGLSRPVDGIFRRVIEGLNILGKRVVSVDVPSGLDATSGKVLGACVMAHTTVTFTFAKKGFFKGLGRIFTGRVIVKGIGIPASVIKKDSWQKA